MCCWATGCLSVLCVVRFGCELCAQRRGGAAPPLLPPACPGGGSMNWSMLLLPPQPLRRSVYVFGSVRFCSFTGLSLLSSPIPVFVSAWPTRSRRHVLGARLAAGAAATRPRSRLVRPCASAPPSSSWAAPSFSVGRIVERCLGRGPLRVLPLGQEVRRGCGPLIGAPAVAARPPVFDTVWHSRYFYK